LNRFFCGANCCNAKKQFCVEEKAAATGEASTQLVAYCGTRDPVYVGFVMMARLLLDRSRPNKKNISPNKAYLHRVMVVRHCADPSFAAKRF
jgi:hypothetical protein